MQANVWCVYMRRQADPVAKTCADMKILEAKIDDIIILP